MAGKIKGIQVEIGGDTTSLTKALASVKSQAGSIQGELKQVERLLKLDPKNTELLAQKEKLLADRIEIVREKLQGLKKAQEEAEKQIKEGAEVNEKSYRTLKREIINAEQELKSLTEQRKKFEEVGKNIQNVGNKMTEVGQKGMKLSAAITGVAAGAVAATEANREYREDLNRLYAAFEVGNFSVTAAKDVYREFYKVLGEEDRSVEAVNHLAKLCRTEEELSKWSDICAGVSATFGDSLPIEGLTEAANETAKVSKVTGPLADALNWVGISEDQFNEALEKCNTEQERSQMITSTLHDTYLSAAQSFREMNADVMQNRETVADYNDQMAELTTQIEPILTSIKGMAVEILTWFNNLSDGSKKLTVGIAGVVAAVPPLLSAGGKVVSTVGKITEALGKTKLASDGFGATIKSLGTLLAAHPVAAAVGFATAVVGIAYACDESAQAVVALSKETKQLAKDAKDLIYETDQTERSISAEADTANNLIDRLYQLEGQTDKTAEVKEEMRSIVDQLNSLIPNLNLALNEETGTLNLQRQTVQGLANDYINLAYAKAYASQLEVVVSKKIEAQAKQEEIEEQYASLYDGIPNRTKGWSIANARNNIADLKAESLIKSYNKNEDTIKALDQEINELSKKAAEYQSKINQPTNEGSGYQSVEGGGRSVGNRSTGSGGTSRTSGSGGRVETAVETAKKQFDEEYKLLKYYLQNSEISETEYYQKLEKMRDDYLEDGSDDYRTYTNEILQGYRDMDFRNLKYYLDMGYITEAEYYDQLEQLRDHYYLKGSAEWQNYTLEITNFQKKAIEEAGEKIRNTVDEITENTKTRLDEVQQKETSLSEQLKGERGLLTGEDGIYNLTNYKLSNQSMQDYIKTREELEQRLKPILGNRYSEFMEDVMSGTQEEGRIAAHILTHMNDRDLNIYLEEWRRYQEGAEKLAADTYSEEVTQIKNGYFEEILKLPEEMQAEFEACGKSLADFVSMGFETRFDQLLERIKEQLVKSVPNMPDGFFSAVSGRYGSSIDNSKTTTFNQQISVSGSGADMAQAGKKLFNSILLAGVL